MELKEPGRKPVPSVRRDASKTYLAYPPKQRIVFAEFIQRAIEASVMVIFGFDHDRRFSVLSGTWEGKTIKLAATPQTLGLEVLEVKVGPFRRLLLKIPLLKRLLKYRGTAENKILRAVEAIMTILICEETHYKRIGKTTERLSYPRWEVLRLTDSVSSKIRLNKLLWLAITRSRGQEIANKVFLYLDEPVPQEVDPAFAA